MTRSIVASGAAAALALAAVAGCSVVGLSPHEVPGRTQSAYLYSLYAETPPEARNLPVLPMRTPSNVAIVQVGEVAPPAALVERMRSDPAVFARVETLPGTAYGGEAWGGHDHGDRHHDHWRRRRPDGLVDARAHVTALRNLAADMGMDYLLLVGGSVDYGTTTTPLSLMNLTIVGAFVVPSEETNAKARASGALVDVRTGRVMVNSSAEATKQSWVPPISVEGEQMKLLTALRDDVVERLGANVVADARMRAQADLGAGFPPAAKSVYATPAPQAPDPFKSSIAFDPAPVANVQNPDPAPVNADPRPALAPLPRVPHAQHYETASE